MKKLVYLIICGLIFFSCSNFNSTEESEIKITENTIEKVYFKKDSSDEFKKFLKLSESRKLQSRNLENEEITNENLFSLMWEDLSEEEKNKLIDNSDEINIQIESGLEIPIKNEFSRSILNGNTEELDFLAANFSFSEHLKYWFGNTMISIDLLPEEYFPKVEEKEIYKNVLLSNVIENLSHNENWGLIEKILKELNSEISLKMIQTEYEKLKEFDLRENTSRSSGASVVTDFYSNPLINDFGDNLKDGTVLLTAGKKKAFLIAGNWAHAGIFSKKLYNSTEGDKSYCVYTAQLMMQKKVHLI